MFALPSIFMLYYAKEGDEAMPRHPNPNRPPWASAIAEARMKAGLTQEELSEKTSIPLTSIKKYERGVRVPRYDVLQDIASATGADINTFIPPENQRAKSDEFSDLVNPAFSEILKSLLILILYSTLHPVKRNKHTNNIKYLNFIIINLSI